MIASKLKPQSKEITHYHDPYYDRFSTTPKMSSNV